jgi:hypothetical protein
VSDRPEPYDEGRLLAAVDRFIQQARLHGFYGASDDAVARDRHHGDRAAGIVLWITGGWDDAEAYDAAEQLLHGEPVDPRRQKVLDHVRGLAASEITWEALARIEKKALIRRERPTRPAPPSADAVPLDEALLVLAGMLETAGVASDRPDALIVWSTFKDFADLPVAATSPLYVENDMCLFQWSASEHPGEGRHFEWDLTRQFVIHHEDGNYDHLEQMSVTLLFDPDDPRLTALAPGDVWSGDDLAGWFGKVEALDAFVIPTAGDAVSSAMRLHHENV